MEFLFQNLFLYFSTWFGFGFGFDLGLGFTETFWFGFGFCQNRKSGFVRSLQMNYENFSDTSRKARHKKTSIHWENQRQMQKNQSGFRIWLRLHPEKFVKVCLQCRSSISIWRGFFPAKQFKIPKLSLNTAKFPFNLMGFFGLPIQIITLSEFLSSILFDSLSISTN